MGKELVKNIKFECVFTVNEKAFKDAKDPKQYRKESILATLGNKIDEAKPDMWQDVLQMPDVRIYTAQLYIFTPAELKAWKQRVIDKVKSGEL